MALEFRKQGKSFSLWRRKGAGVMHGNMENGLYSCIDNSGWLRALFGAVGLKMGHNGTTANSALGGIHGSNRLPLE
jgi:hypothetical protein